MKRPTASGDAARDAAGRLTTGSRVLADRITTGAAAWVRAGRRDDLTGIPAVLGCWGRLMTLAGAAYGLHAVLRAVPWGMWAATAVWCWKAWRAAAPRPTTTTSRTPERTAGSSRSRAPPST